MRTLLTPSLLVFGLLCSSGASAQPAKEAPKKGLSLGKVAESEAGGFSRNSNRYGASHGGSSGGGGCGFSC